jgi:hypothetical protein
MKVLLTILAVLVLTVSLSYAEFSAEVSGTQITIAATEPTTNEDGSDLKDLHHCNANWQKSTDTIPTKEADIVATAVTGGGAINYQFIVPAVSGEDVDVSIWGTCTDDANNESKKSEVIIQNIDKQVPSTWY